MTAQILVALKRNDRAEEIIPYIEQVTQPGMKVVFLMPVQDSKVNCWRDRRTFMEVEKQTRLATGLPAGYSWESKASLAQERHFPVCEYSWENQKYLYQKNLFPLCEPLRQKECEVSVALYTGSLRKTLRYYALGNDRCLIMVRGGVGLWITRFMQGAIPIFDLFKRTECAPMLLLRSNRV